MGRGWVVVENTPSPTPVDLPNVGGWGKEQQLHFLLTCKSIPGLSTLILFTPTCKRHLGGYFTQWRAGEIPRCSSYYAVVNRSRVGGCFFFLLLFQVIPKSSHPVSSCIPGRLQSRATHWICTVTDFHIHSSPCTFQLLFSRGFRTAWTGTVRTAASAMQGASTPTAKTKQSPWGAHPPPPWFERGMPWPLPKGRGSSTRRFTMSKRSHLYLIAAWRLEWRGRLGSPAHPSARPR